MRVQLLGQRGDSGGQAQEPASAPGVPLHTVEHWFTNDTQGFKKRRALADRIALGVVEAAIHLRGVEGIEKPIFNTKGERTGSILQYSDNLLMFRAKRLDPEYKDNPPPVPDDSAKQALEAMTRAVVQFNQTNVQINISNAEAGSEKKPGADIIDMIQNPTTSPEDKPATG